MGRSRKSRNKATKQNIRENKSATAQSEQILDLKKEVNLNTRKLQGVRYKVQHTLRGGGIIAATSAQPFRAWALNNPSQMGQIFSAPDEGEGGKYNFDNQGRFYLQMNITSGTEISPMSLSVFILRPKTMKVAVSAGINVPIAPNPPPPALPTPPIQLIVGTDFVNSLGLSMVNKKRWHIDGHWAVNTSPIVTGIQGGGGPPAPLINWQGDLHPIRKYYKGKNMLKLNNRTGKWSDTLDHAVNPTQRQFLVIFNNNLNQQLSPNLNFQCLWTAFTSE